MIVIIMINKEKQNLSLSNTKLLTLFSWIIIVIILRWLNYGLHSPMPYN